MQAESGGAAQMGSRPRWLYGCPKSEGLEGEKRSQSTKGKHVFSNCIQRFYLRPKEKPLVLYVFTFCWFLETPKDGPKTPYLFNQNFR